ncbi:hypothetical protein [Pedobacter heparinus]|uniref:hypothetical protein n=1 Tax=Pedobacter heparinus TaxID=984 RepID=UPI00292DEFF9|nr:hypothetical protein [Pedobacter heparinus]
MKTSIGILLISIIAACKPGVDYKTVRDEVMKFHDIVMADQGVVVNNQMKLDTLLKDMKDLKTRFPAIDTGKEKETINALMADLTKAENSMNDWMHKFEPDVSGKSNEAAVQYFKAEMAKIVAVDSLYKQEIKSSGAYLHKFGK